jgi:MtaA/CmuA family methyltransferase
MTPKERVSRRLRGESVDKIPNLNILMTFAAKYIKVPYRRYVTDYRCLVEGNITCCEKFGIDMVSAISDPCREAHGFGANITFPEDDVPQCKDYLLKEYSYIEKLKIKNPLDCERMLDRINAVKLFKKEVGAKFPILGWIEGPIAESSDLRGLGSIMTDIYDAPEFLKKLLEICTQQAILFSAGQIDAGADFIGIGDAAASLVGPKIYKEFVLPYEQRIVNAIHQKGAKAKLHICGNISSILDIIPFTGADMIDIDWMVDFKAANEIFKGRCSACGNFDPVRILLQGSGDDVEKAVISCVNDSSKTSFIAAGCEVPKMTSVENLLRVDSSIKK